MKLYVLIGDHKFYLLCNAPTRIELSKQLCSRFVTCAGKSYHLNEVKAELEASLTGSTLGLSGSVIGAIAGAVTANPLLVAGSIAGFLSISGSMDSRLDNQAKKVERFNAVTLMM